MKELKIQPFAQQADDGSVENHVLSSDGNTASKHNQKHMVR